MVKVEGGTPTIAKSKYPYLGRWVNGREFQIVLFTKEKEGVLLNCDRGVVGRYSETWPEYNFVAIPVGESVTITQL